MRTVCVLACLIVGAMEDMQGGNLTRTPMRK